MAARQLSISSESDVDEFYDAEESTPGRTSRQTSNNDGTAHQTQNSNAIQELEVEKQRLLDQMQEAKERRNAEENALQLKLAELEKLKKEEIEKAKKQKEANLRAQENAERRRKLENMRNRMTEETTPTRAPPKPPRLLSDFPGAVGEDTDTMLFHCDRDLSAPGVAYERIYSSPEMAAAMIPVLNNVTQSASRSEQLHTSMENLNIAIQGVNLNETGDDSMKAVTSKHVLVLPHEELSKASTISSTASLHYSASSSNKGDTSTAESGLSLGAEPDLIQSTKSSSLPRAISPTVPVDSSTPQPPPRRKKKIGSENIDPRDDAMSVQSSASELSTGELETPSTTVYNLTRDLEESLGMPPGGQEGQSLDITEATRGQCNVMADEDLTMRPADVTISADLSAEEQFAEAREQLSRGHGHEILPSDVPGEVRIRCRTGDPDNPETVEVSMKRLRSPSGSRYLTDEEILDHVMVLNLDTGEKVPLSLAEDKLPKCINPLSLHIMRRTKEYSSDSSLHKEQQSDDDDKISIASGGHNSKSSRSKRKARKIKNYIGKKLKKVKARADEVFHGEDQSSDDDEFFDGRRMIKVKASHSHKGPYDFDLLVPVQDLSGEHQGAVWTMKFSQCGRLLATGGQDNKLRVWVLKDAYSYFDDMRLKYSEATKLSSASSMDSMNSAEGQEGPNLFELAFLFKSAQYVFSGNKPHLAPSGENDAHSPFRSRPFCVYHGHTADLLDISWSKNYFILSASMDKTVRLWHVSRKECLCCFQHIDFVTAIAFHPKDDRYFLSASLDGKLRLWNIPEKKVALWNEVTGSSKLCTAANFCMDGKLAAVGTYDGRCILYTTDHLKYYTQIHVRSTRGKNARGRKITGVEACPGEDKILVTSNDSRIRLYDLRDLTLTCKYKGCANNSSQIKANFSEDGKYIVSGSEDKFVYIWRTHHDFHKFYSVRRDRNGYWEGIKAHMAVVTAAIFAPVPRLIIKPQFEFMDSEEPEAPACRGEVLVSADYGGAIKVFLNKFKPGSG